MNTYIPLSPWNFINMSKKKGKTKEGMYTFHNFRLSKCKFTLNFDVQTQIWCGCDINALFCINFNLIMVYVNHKCFFNQMMAISHPFTSCINWNELGTLMDRVCSFSCVKDVYLFSIKVSNMAGIKYQLRMTYSWIWIIPMKRN